MLSAVFFNFLMFSCCFCHSHVLFPFVVSAHFVPPNPPFLFVPVMDKSHLFCWMLHSVHNICCGQGLIIGVYFSIRWVFFLERCIFSCISFVTEYAGACDNRPQAKVVLYSGLWCGSSLLGNVKRCSWGGWSKSGGSEMWRNSHETEERHLRWVCLQCEQWNGGWRGG